ncbi:MAG: YrhB domain-containing protein [Planctomycetia bacterium]|nr:YrhB domain-containing protein [Planctomycetia bacterium]
MSKSSEPQASLTKQQALEIAKKTLAELPNGDEYVIQEADTVERPFGWVFFYNTRKYIETKDPGYIRPGNGPLVVERSGGATTFLTTSVPPHTAIAEFEKLWLQRHEEP